MRLLLIVTLSLVSLIQTKGQKAEETAIEIVRKMFSENKKISGMTFTMKKKERIKSSMPFQESDVKLLLQPFKLYLKQKSPKKGLEVLYVDGLNNNKALVNTNGFPWVNLNLDPMGSVMRENQHHTIFESGYTHLISILEHLTNKYQEQLEGIVIKTGPVLWEGNNCWIITFNNPYFKYIQHTVQPNETVLSIAKKWKLSEHMIMEKNGISHFGALPVGKVLVIPNDYSPKLELYVDVKRYIPLVMKVYDDKGLYEHYEYSNVVLNPSFEHGAFEKFNPAYGF